MPTSAVESPMTKSAGTSGAGGGGGGGDDGVDGEAAAAAVAEQRRAAERERRRAARNGAIPGARGRWRWRVGALGRRDGAWEEWWADRGGLDAGQAGPVSLPARLVGSDPSCWSDLVRASFYFICLFVLI